jgi:hypothetical protein
MNRQHRIHSLNTDLRIRDRIASEHSQTSEADADRNQHWYEVRVEGHLDQRWSSWFDGLTITREGQGITRLCGAIPDQAALLGVLLKIWNLAIPLIELRRIEPTMEDISLYNASQQQCAIEDT